VIIASTGRIVMAAYADQVLKKGFILDEERIRKINELLIVRGREVSIDCRPSYMVYRADAFNYVTEDIQDILNENNADWQRLLRITVTMKHIDDFSLILDFDKETSLHIEGKDRDLVFLIFSELRLYLTNEVNTLADTGAQIRTALIFAGVLALIAFTWWIARGTPSQGPPVTSLTMETALASGDLQTKLNYIIENLQSQGSTLPIEKAPWLIAMFVVITIIVLGRNAIMRPINALYPSHVFLIGKETEKHANRLALRQNIFWGVIVAAAISLIIGLMVR
jgi:hypothetical protein